jgi:RNA polymerase sigma-70 factor (ECF subfamily)
MNSKLDANTSEAAELWLQEAEIATLRRDMLRFAKLQLRDVATAEDAVQEALSAAYATRGRFAGRAQVKTWIFSILRHKIIDQIRSQTRHPTHSLTQDDGRDAEVGALFDDGGYWHKAARPADWGDPEAALGSEQFWVIFEICLNAMAENTARIFTMREFLGLETAEICNELGISENNCWVILHRARSRLRLCLEENWIKRG